MSRAARGADREGLVLAADVEDREDLRSVDRIRATDLVDELAVLAGEAATSTLKMRRLRGSRLESAPTASRTGLPVLALLREHCPASAVERRTGSQEQKPSTEGSATNKQVCERPRRPLLAGTDGRPRPVGLP